MNFIDSGIYKIVCYDNNKFYIGSSIDINRRLKQHISLLKNNKHENQYLQKSWNQYGEQNFRYEIIETIHDISQLFIREKWWLDATKCYKRKIGFNICSSPGGFGEGRFRDLIGQKFNKLTVIEYVGKTKNGVSKWKCLCDCGKIIIVSGGNLKNGNTKSCGCFKIQKSKENLKLGPKSLIIHNLSNSRTYHIWENIIQRCTNPKNTNYKYYGGRNPPIAVCDKWNPKTGGSFKNFLTDMGECPEGLSLNRIDNDDGYYKENCRWVLSADNNKNKRNNIMVPFNEKFLCLKDYCKELNLNYKVILWRISTRGLSVEKALATPIRCKKEK